MNSDATFITIFFKRHFGRSTFFSSAFLNIFVVCCWVPWYLVDCYFTSCRVQRQGGTYCKMFSKMFMVGIVGHLDKKTTHVEPRTVMSTRRVYLYVTKIKSNKKYFGGKVLECSGDGIFGRVYSHMFCVFLCTCVLRIFVYMCFVYFCVHVFCVFLCTCVLCIFVYMCFACMCTCIPLNHEGRPRAVGEGQRRAQDPRVPIIDHSVTGSPSHHSFLDWNLV